MAEGLLRSSTALSRKSQREIAAAVLPAFIRAIEMNSSLNGLTLRAADIALTADDLPTAVRYLREFTNDRPQELPILEQIAATLILAGLPNEADSYLQLVAMEKPERTNLYPVLGNLYDELGIPARAEIYRVLALHVAKNPPLSDYLRLALLQLKLNQPRRAGVTLESASRIYSDSIQLLLIRGLTEKPKIVWQRPPLPLPKSSASPKNTQRFSMLAFTMSTDRPANSQANRPARKSLCAELFN